MVRGGGGVAGGEERRFGRGWQKLFKCLVKKTPRPATAVLQPEREPTGRSQSGNRRRHKAESICLRHVGSKALVEFFQNLPGLKAARASLFPRFQRHEKEPVVRRRHARQKTEARHAAYILHTFGFSENPFDFLAHLISARQRRRRRKLGIQQKVSIILFRKKAGRQFATNGAVNQGKAGQ